MTDLLDVLASIEREDVRARTRSAQLPLAFAAKWAAETTRAEPPRTLEPTDANLATMFRDCVRSPRPEWYPAIRDAIEGES